MKLDRNGYAPSLFNTEDGFCYLHKDYCQTVRHEVIHGARRQLAKKYGLWINVCPLCHNDIHANDNGEYLYLKQQAQQLFEEEYPNEDFLTKFGKNYYL